MESMPRPASPLISHDAVVEASLLIIDREGLDAFSLPRLARELNVAAPSLYHHFADRADILRTVARAIVLATRLPDLGGLVRGGQPGVPPGGAQPPQRGADPARVHATGSAGAQLRDRRADPGPDRGPAPAADPGHRGARPPDAGGLAGRGGQEPGPGRAGLRQRQPGHRADARAGTG